MVLLDLSGRFSVLRLQHLMHIHIASLCSTSSFALPEQEISSLVSDSFSHLHIFRPQSSSSFLATLTSLPSFLLSQPSTHLSANRPLGLLAINDLSAFLWQDRLEADEETDLPVSNHTEKANNTLFLERYRSVISSLRHIQHLFSCTIVATNWGLAPVTLVAGHPALRPHLPSVWNNFCTVKVVVERNRVSKFGPGLSAEEAKREGVQRWEAVEKSGFCGWINWWGTEGWREEVREGVRGLKGGGGFSFRVTGDGIMVAVEGDWGGNIQSSNECKAVTRQTTYWHEGWMTLLTKNIAQTYSPDACFMDSCLSKWIKTFIHTLVILFTRHCRA